MQVGTTENGIIFINWTEQFHNKEAATWERRSVARLSTLSVTSTPSGR